MTESDLRECLQQNALLWCILSNASGLNLNDWYVGAGAICQTVWNINHGKTPAEGIQDIDLIYFDNTDLSAQAESRVQRLVSNSFSNLPIPIEAVNQARVHLWYRQEFGFDIRPYRSSREAIDSWPTTASSIGVRLSRDESFSVYAPFGLSDIDNMIVRPNKALINQTIYESKALRWKKAWPKLTIIDWNAE